MAEKPTAIHPQTIPGIISLTVSNIERSLAFYHQVIGLHILSEEGNAATLGSATDDEELVQPIVRITEDPHARAYTNRTGIYHFAILVPSRLELARSLRRIVQENVEPGGYSDHLVSEAIYLSDPDGIGIEIYHDRPRSEWPYRSGQIQMATLPLDVDGLLDEIKNDPNPTAEVSARTVLGHVHLKVADILQSESFYIDVLGFELVVRYGSAASFVSAGGYHHHIGFNVWESAGAPPPPAGAIGMRYFSLVFPDSEVLRQQVERVRSLGIPVDYVMNEGYFLRDPSQNAILLSAAGS